MRRDRARARTKELTAVRKSMLRVLLVVDRALSAAVLLQLIHKRIQHHTSYVSTGVLSDVKRAGPKWG